MLAGTVLCLTNILILTFYLMLHSRLNEENCTSSQWEVFQAVRKHSTCHDAELNDDWLRTFQNLLVYLLIVHSCLKLFQCLPGFCSPCNLNKMSFSMSKSLEHKYQCLGVKESNLLSVCNSFVITLKLFSAAAYFLMCQSLANISTMDSK